jgi:hypothetical protein
MLARTREDDDEETGVITTLADGSIEIRFQGIPPFELPRETAIRFGALLCKRAGCEIQFRQGSMKVRFPRGFEFGNENSKIGETVN